MRFKLIASSIVAVLLSGCSTGSLTLSPSEAHSIAVGDVQKVSGALNVIGEIVGKPAANSKFNALMIGMTLKEVKTAVGEPTTQIDYKSYKDWLPFYYGKDRDRSILLYKGLGRLSFRSGSVYGSSSEVLVRIVHDSGETGAQ